jgi:SAM-dependent methyltransferase
MKTWGYDIVGVDASPTLIEYAREADPTGDYRVSDAAELPFDSSSFDLVTAFMALHDIDEPRRAISEVGRVLADGGVFCAAIVHPMASAGRFDSREPDARYVIEDSYLDTRLYADTVERDGLAMTFASEHRPLHAYFDLLSASRFVVDRLVEVPDLSDPAGSRWRRVPLFLHFRALKLSR